MEEVSGYVSYWATQLKERTTKHRDLCKTKGLRLLGPYVKALEKCLHKCLLCKTEFMIRPNDVATRKPGFNGCPTCQQTKHTENRTYSLAHYRKVIHAHGKVKVLELLPRTETTLYARVQCVKCGGEQESRVPDLQNGSGCFDCAKRSHSGFKFKTFKLGRRRVRVQGFEPFALKRLLRKGVQSQDILVCHEGTPVIEYAGRKHYPDIYVKSSNTLIEVKSDWTLGLHAEGSTWFNTCKAKALAAIASGYKYKLWMFDGKGKRIKLPSDWYLQKRKHTLDYIRKE